MTALMQRLELRRALGVQQETRRLVETCQRTRLADNTILGGITYTLQSKENRRHPTIQLLLVRGRDRSTVRFLLLHLRCCNDNGRYQRDRGLPF